MSIERNKAREISLVAENATVDNMGGLAQVIQHVSENVYHQIDV